MSNKVEAKSVQDIQDGAKRIQKVLNLSKKESLDYSARQHGFSSYQHAKHYFSSPLRSFPKYETPMYQELEHD